MFFFSLRGFEDSESVGSHSTRPLWSCVTLGKGLTVSGPVSLREAWEKSLSPRVVDRIQSLGKCSRWLLPLYLWLPVPSRRGWDRPIPRSSCPTPWAAPLHCEPPKPAPAHSAMLGGWHRTRREQEAGPRRRQHMGTSWAGGWGGLAAAWSAGLAAPPPPPVAQSLPASGFPGRRRGRGAWLGFRAGREASLSGPFLLQAPSRVPGRLRSAGLTHPWPARCPLQRPLGHRSPRVLASAATLSGAFSLPRASLASFKSHLLREALPV